RSILRKAPNVSVILAEATAVDVEAKTVRLKDGALAYDYLVLAAGASHSYFGHDEWAPLAPGLKTVEDALQVRRRIFLAYEAAEREEDPERRREWLTFVIVGAGPTGVEMAGALAEIARRAMPHEFRRIRPAEARVVLVEALDRVLPPYPEPLSERARRQLEGLGFEVRRGARVTRIDARGVALGEERIGARTVVWGAGVQASSLTRSLGAPLDKSGRVLARDDLSVPGRPEVFVVGDLVSLDQDGRPVPGVAPAAMQEGRHAARNILRAIQGEAPLPFRYRDRGDFAVIGRGAAVGQPFRRFFVSGFPAWLAWLGIHLFFLIGFRNRVFVLLHWAYMYLTYRRGARLITGETPPLVEEMTKGVDQ
ncbi:MAG TPA: NAD(P)/FAD-dependent oxidoreductase, partial [Vicinamibacteria bacterium]|nr:NAD(P)/FAD-dependent oxidoreductase [Vicinamibacteria bacterium]